MLYVIVENICAFVWNLWGRSGKDFVDKANLNLICKSLINRGIEIPVFKPSNCKHSCDTKINKIT